MKRNAEQPAAAPPPRDKRRVVETRLAATWQTVCALLDLGPTAGHKLRKADPRFPKPIPLPGVKAHWWVSEIEDYLRLLAAQRDGISA